MQSLLIIDLYISERNEKFQKSLTLYCMVFQVHFAKLFSNILNKRKMKIPYKYTTF